MDQGNPKEMPVALVIEYENAAELSQDYTENLSSGGAFVHTDRDLEVDQAVRLVLSFPGLITPLIVDGKVRWSRSVATGEQGVGIEFINFDSDARAKLEAVLAELVSGNTELVQQVFRVLLVEDNPHVARLIRDGLSSKKLGGASFSFCMAHNGREALDQLEREAVDVMVTDVYLPVMDGPTLIARVRSDERFRKLPIIAVSAGGASAREEALGAGADYFLDKPMRLREILEGMRKTIGRDL